MRKIILTLIVAILLFCLAIPGFCANRSNWGNTDLYPLLKRELPYDFVHIGAERGGVSTMVSGSLAIPLSCAVVLKQVGSEQPLTLANGTPGQILTIVISTNASSLTATLSPTTTTGFTTITFNAALDSVTLLYLDDTYGWIIIGQNSVTVS